MYYPAAKTLRCAVGMPYATCRYRRATFSANIPDTVWCDQCAYIGMSTCALLRVMLCCSLCHVASNTFPQHKPYCSCALSQENFPADFVAEGLDQTRGWFYTLMVLSTALFDKPTFKNLVCNGLVLASDGKKMSKRLQNYPVCAKTGCCPSYVSPPRLSAHAPKGRGPRDYIFLQGL